jgi:phage shock protein E
MKVMWRLAAPRALALVLAASTSGAPTMPRAQVASELNARIAETGIFPGIIDGEAAHTLVAAGIKVVDVRTPAEFATGHVPGAVNIPHDEMTRRYGELGPASTPVLTYCKSGRRSALAIATLRDKGFTQLYDLQSYDNWALAEATPAAR